MKILFICAHPDDLELCVGEFIYRINKSHQVVIISATRGEWGTVNKRLKGRWLAKIRERELKEAARVNGISSRQVQFFNYIDGQLHFKEPIISEIESYIMRNKFDIIFAPEYFFTYYFHSDHTNLGKIILITILKNIRNYRPRLFFYHSIYNNVYLKVDMKRTHRAVMKHRTQILIIGFFIALRVVINLINGILSKKILFAEGVREVNYEKEMNLKLPVYLRIIFHGLSIGKTFQKAWTAEDE
ncbi:MAG: PIG-L family deacetylase [Candidatus Helarchaeota archaeon]